MTDYMWSQLTTLARFHSETGISKPTLSSWTTGDEPLVSPVLKEGNMNFYLISELKEVAGKKGMGNKVGYVHPDKHAEVVDRAERLAVENSNLINENAYLMTVVEDKNAELLQAEAWRENAEANFNGLQAEYNSLKAEYDSMIEKTYPELSAEESMDRLEELVSE